MKENKLVSEEKRIISEQQKRIKMLEEKLHSYEQYIAENQALRSENIVAEQIQRSMLPSAYPAFAEFPQIDLYADTDTAREVGGDFYDYFVIDDKHIAFGVSDVEGKGIPAAMYMAVAKSLIKLRLQSGEALGDVFTNTNTLFSASSMRRRFITSWTAVFDTETGRMSCVNAGHNYPILFRKNGTPELVKNKSGIPLASYFSKKHPCVYKEFELNLEKGDILFLYTDGVAEAQNSQGASFGTSRLMDAIKLYMSSDHSMKELTAYIRRQVIAFSNHADQDDDITILALKY